MDIIVDGTSYPTWDDVPQHLKTAIANSGPQPTPEPAVPPAGAIDLDDLDQLVMLAEAAELRRAQGLPPVDPAHPIGQALPETLDAPSPVFELNGRRYQSIDEVPAEIREALRHELLATPRPALEPKVPLALAEDLPSAPATITDEGLIAMVATDPAGPKPPMISRSFQVGIGLMIAMIVAIYLAVFLLA